MSDDCPIELFMPELKIHEDECKYRKVKCPKCLKDISLISLLDHLTVVGRLNFKKKSTFFYKICI